MGWPYYIGLAPKAELWAPHGVYQPLK